MIKCKIISIPIVFYLNVMYLQVHFDRESVAMLTATLHNNVR